MPDIELSSASTEGYAVTSVIGDWQLAIDATNEEGPNPNEALAATYASCFVPAFRVGANKEGFDDIGTVDQLHRVWCEHRRRLEHPGIPRDGERNVAGITTSGEDWLGDQAPVAVVQL